MQSWPVLRASNGRVAGEAGPADPVALQQSGQCLHFVAARAGGPDDLGRPGIEGAEPFGEPERADGGCP